MSDQYQKLWEASRQGDVEAVERSLKFIDDIDTRNDKGWNAIILAAYHMKEDVVRFLVERGADINSTNHKGTSVLMYAKSATVNDGCRDMSMLVAVLSMGADLNHIDSEGKTVLDYAEENGEVEIVDFIGRISN